VAAVVGALWLAPGALAAGWCGTGEETTDRPDVGTGALIHLVYAVPSDGPDDFVNVANALADDTAAITAWWHTQDATREPRWDLATFPACAALDISFVRLSDTGAAIAGTNRSGFARISELISRVPLAHRYKRYLIYYDGPPFNDDVCGTASGAFDRGPSYAVVWIRACAGVERDAVAAHELLHALGAVPRGAPHPFSPFDLGHVGDSTQDVLYPQAQVGMTLADRVLDVNHDDYYAHPGGWPDIQDSAWLHRLDQPNQRLSVVLEGSGRVTSSQPGLACDGSCAVDWDGGSIVTLSGFGTDSTRFVGWRGRCTGLGDCTVTLTQPETVTAVFGPRRVPVRAAVSGNGRVLCSPRCGTSFHAGTPLTLRAVAAKGWSFRGWTGQCRGRGAVCHPATDFGFTTRAVFKKRG
jgi:hypothetical protein